MRSISAVVINLSFIGTFFATAALSIVILLAPVGGGWVANLLANTGAVLLLVGTFLVTVCGIVPVINRLAGVTADDDSSAGVWDNYLGR
ncbi:MAG: hypothetical protein QNJ19_13560 [Woeseiaceae bacterium]|nr:hypothetical protein [Woeseiaceae bacterium]